jgi:hypothetical protein
MTQTLKAPLVSLALAVAMMFAVAMPATAQPVNQEGLVNVNVGDVTVQVPVAIAANVCGVAVNVLAELVAAGDVECEAIAESEARSPGKGQGPANRPVNQEGLINLNLGDVTVQIPVAVAANICGVAVNVLAQVELEGDVTCEAITDAVAAA